jgi:arylsulfatase A
VWTHEPHYPIKSDPAFKALYPDLGDDIQREHHANVTQLDHAFGRLMRALDELGLTGETLVFFTSDNGPEGDGIRTPGRGSTGGLRGRKRSVYEGGIRVPGMVRWPGRVTPGTVTDEPVIGSDVFVTALRAAGAPVPADRVIDGGDLLPALAGRPVERARPLYWRCVIAPEPLKTAMRIGDWKILADEPLTKFELYNLRQDRAETTELSAREPAKLAEMTAALRKLNAEIESEGPGWWRTYNSGNEGKAKGKKAKASAK